MCLVLGAWCLVLGAWCLVLGAWGVGRWALVRLITVEGAKREDDAGVRLHDWLRS
jgi:hypothetical protein